MGRKEELAEREKAILAELTDIRAELHAIALAEVRERFGLYVGVVVKTKKGVFRVSAIDRRFVPPWLKGHKKTTKGWHASEQHIWGAYEIVQDGDA